MFTNIRNRQRVELAPIVLLKGGSSGGPHGKR